VSQYLDPYRTGGTRFVVTVVVTRVDDYRLPTETGEVVRTVTVRTVETVQDATEVVRACERGVEKM
jgi:hypothetical protein